MAEKSFKLSIGNRILLGFSILIVIYLGIALISYHEMEEISVLADKAVPLNSQVSSLQEFAISMEILERDLDKYFIVNNNDNQDKANKDFEKLNSIIGSLKKNANNDSINSFQDMEIILHEINMNFNDIVTLKNNRTNSREINEKRILIYQLINNNTQKNNELLLETHNNIQANFHDQQSLIYANIKEFLILNIFILILGVFLSFHTSRSISRPIEKLKNATTEIGQGRLNINIPIQSNDEVGQLASAFNKMAKDLQKSTVSNDYVENIIRSMFDALVVATPDGTIRTVNKAVCDLLGYGPEEIVGQPIDKLFSQENARSENTWLDELLKKGSIINLEKTYLAKDGKKIPVLFSMSTMCDDKGYISGIVCVAKDITERKRTEDLLKKSKEFAETVLNSMNDAISVIDVNNSRIIDANSVFLTDYGMKKEEVIGKKCYEITHKRAEPCIPPDYICPLMDTLKTGDHSTAEHVHYMKNGEKRYVEVSTSPIMDETGKIYNVIHVARDITRHKQMEDTLRRNEEHFRSVTENVLDIITVLDTYGTISYESPSVERVLGYKPEELIGKNAFELIHPEDLPGVMGALTKGSQNPGSAQSTEYRFKNKDGSWRVLESIGKIIIDNAGTTEIIVNSRDITDRRQDEEARQISERKYATLVEKGNDGIIIIKDGLLKFINSKMVSIAGFPITELIEKPFIDFVTLEYRRFVIDNYIKRLSGYDAPNNYEIEIISKEGKNIPVEINASIIDYEGKRADMAIIRDITERKRAQDALREVNSHLRTLINHLHAGILMEDEHHTIMHVNQAFCDMFTIPVTPELLTGADCSQSAQQSKSLFADPEEFVARINALLTNRQMMTDEVLLLADGRVFERDFIPVYFENEFVGYIWQYRDITERKKTEKLIEASLQEKETLLKEIHHRVKNNMQIVSSLLDHQTRYIKDKNVIDIFTESQNRIASMALVHEKLYQSKDLARIDFYDYINDLVANLFQSYMDNSSKITLNMNIENIQLDIDFAIPCGLIINELVTNSLKYAFPEGRTGEIMIAFRKIEDNMFELVIGDNGIGLPPDLDFRKTNSLGLHLVTILAENQLHGEIILNRNVGMEFQIKFRGIK